MANPRQRRRSGSTKHHVVFLVVLVLAIVFSSWEAVVVSFTYEREVGGHVRNAYEVNTPEAMIRELNDTVAGMRRIGLVEGMYAAYFPWERTPDRSMAFQYEFIDQLINRTEAVILWRSLAYGGNSTPETLGDVYEQKMDNLRSFMTEGCSARTVCTDWIARDVYLINKAAPFYFSTLFGSASWSLMIFSLALFVLVRLDEYRLRVLKKPRFGLTPESLRSVRRYFVLPIYVLGFVLMALPFVLAALGPAR